MSGNGITIFYSADVIPEPNTDLVYNVKMTEVWSFLFEDQFVFSSILN